MPARALSTTHLSLLCLLSLRPWSAYELVGHLRRSLDLIWPRAQSNLYADLKRLAEAGLATREAVRVGRRRRTMYTITASGTAALATWLGEPGLPPTFECEALVKLAYVPDASQPAALAQVAVLARHAEARLALGRRVAQQYLQTDRATPENDGASPEVGAMPEVKDAPPEVDGAAHARLHVNAVMWRFLWEQHQAIARWAAWADAEIRAWPTTTDTPALRRRGLAVLRQSLAELDV